MGRKYWAVRLGEGGKFVKVAKAGKFIAIGWNDLGELGYLTTANIDPKVAEQELEKDLERTYQSDSSLSRSLAKGILWNYIVEMKEGDVVLVPTPDRTVLFGRVTSSYEYVPKPKDRCEYKRRRNMEWLEELDRDDMPEGINSSLLSWLTVFSLDKHAEKIERVLGGILKAKVKEVSGDSLVKEIMERIRTLSPREFEEFVSHLLSMSGLETATTSYVGDKGVDVVGTLSRDGLTNIKLNVQVRRVRQNIGIKTVQRIRGTLGPNEHGAIVTTSSFTRYAQEEAQAIGRKPIALIDGEMLVDLILKYFDRLDDKYKQKLPLKRIDLPLKERFTIEIS